MDLTEYADIAFRFMVGIPGSQLTTPAWCLMGPDELKNQRWTYIKYWLRRLQEFEKDVRAAAKG